MRKCKQCGHSKWLVYYDSVEVTFETQMTTLVEEPTDVGTYEAMDLAIMSEDLPTTIDTTLSGIVVSCQRCGWEVEPDTEEALEEWLANEEDED